MFFFLSQPALAEPIDLDQDGWFANANNPFKRDCKDNNPNVNPGATEVVGDIIDEDCDGNDALNRYFVLDIFETAQWSLDNASTVGQQDRLRVESGGHAQIDVNVGNSRGTLRVAVDVVSASGASCTMKVHANPVGGASTSDVEALEGTGTQVLVFAALPPPPARRHTDRAQLPRWWARRVGLVLPAERRLARVSAHS